MSKYCLFGHVYLTHFPLTQMNYLSQKSVQLMNDLQNCDILEGHVNVPVNCRFVIIWLLLAQLYYCAPIVTVNVLLELQVDLKHLKLKYVD